MLLVVAAFIFAAASGSPTGFLSPRFTVSFNVSEQFSITNTSLYAAYSGTLYVDTRSSELPWMALNMTGLLFPGNRIRQMQYRMSGMWVPGMSWNGALVEGSHLWWCPSSNQCIFNQTSPRLMLPVPFKIDESEMVVFASEASKDGWHSSQGPSSVEWLLQVDAELRVPKIIKSDTVQINFGAPKMHPIPSHIFPDICNLAACAHSDCKPVRNMCT